MNGYWFTSSLFQVEPGEDEEISPGRYGRQLAIWLKAKLEQRGYNVEPVIAEDWGRCLPNEISVYEELVEASESASESAHTLVEQDSGSNQG